MPDELPTELRRCAADADTPLHVRPVLLRAAVALEQTGEVAAGRIDGILDVLKRFQDHQGVNRDVARGGIVFLDAMASAFRNKPPITS